MKVKELVKILRESGDQEALVKVGWFGGPVEEPADEARPASLVRPDRGELVWLLDHEAAVGIVIFPSDAYVVIAPAGSIVTEDQILGKSKRPKGRGRR